MRCVCVCSHITPKLLGGFPREMAAYVHAKTCTKMFTAALF